MATVEGVPPGISAFIDSLRLLPQVRTQAKIVYSWLDLDLVPREPKRKKYICHCVNQAYHELGIDAPDPRQICAVVGIDATAGCASIHNKLKYKRGIIPCSPITDPLKLLTGYASNILYLTEDLITIMREVFARFLKTNQWVLANSVREVVTCFILCYLNMNGYAFDNAQVIEAVDADRAKVMELYRHMEAGVAAA